MPTPFLSISTDSSDTPRTEAASRADENGHSIRHQEDASQRTSNNRRIKSPAKLTTKLKPHFASPPRASRRASKSSNCDPKEDNEEATQQQAPTHSGNTLESYVLPKRLRMNRWDVNFLTSGIEVIKVSKVRSIWQSDILDDAL
jgi:hypothetical protein